ncbi:MAG: histidine phosphatase family protein, partial [Firmicutes bacterium]|nr:histidine phosphatase family protein [Bacillota bacterium]
MKLYIVRHGKTDWNIMGLLQGQTNIELNEEGINDARKLSKEINLNEIDLCISSSLERAKQTAEICNYLDKDIIFDSRLEEINFGIFEGLTFKEMSEKYPNETKKMEEDWKVFNYITGESPKEMFQRVVAFLKTLDYAKTNLIVAHWGVINCIISYFISKNLDTYWKFKIKNGSIVIFEGNFKYS